MNLFCRIAERLCLDRLHKWKYDYKGKRECLRCKKKQVVATDGYGIGWVTVKRFADKVKDMY